MELFEEIQREYEFGSGTIAGVARTFGVHRRLVREALGSVIPAETPAHERIQTRVGPAAPFIDEILEADQQAPRKQRHTAHRIYVRRREERPGCPVAESTVHRYVRQQKAERGLLRREMFVPQHYVYGAEAQVDWYETVADLGASRW